MADEDEADDEFSVSSLGEKSSDVDNNQSIEEDGDLEADLDGFSNDFAAFFDVNVSEQVSNLEKIVDSLLGKLEELSAVTDETREESKDRLFNQFPELMYQVKQFEKIFPTIDQIEKFVLVVKECLQEMEEKVTLAEKELGSKNLKKILTSVRLPKFLTQKRQLKPYLKSENEPVRWVEPTKLYNTSDFIMPKRQQLPDLVKLNVNEHDQRNSRLDENT